MSFLEIAICILAAIDFILAFILIYLLIFVLFITIIDKIKIENIKLMKALILIGAAFCIFIFITIFITTIYYAFYGINIFLGAN